MKVAKKIADKIVGMPGDTAFRYQQLLVESVEYTAATKSFDLAPGKKYNNYNHRYFSIKRSF